LPLGFSWLTWWLGVRGSKNSPPGSPELLDALWKLFLISELFFWGEVEGFKFFRGYVCFVCFGGGLEVGSQIFRGDSKDWSGWRVHPFGLGYANGTVLFPCCCRDLEIEPTSLRFIHGVKK